MTKKEEKKVEKEEKKEKGQRINCYKQMRRERTMGAY